MKSISHHFHHFYYIFSHSHVILSSFLISLQHTLKHDKRALKDENREQQSREQNYDEGQVLLLNEVTLLYFRVDRRSYYSVIHHLSTILFLCTFTYLLTYHFCILHRIYFVVASTFVTFSDIWRWYGVFPLLF